MSFSIFRSAPPAKAIGDGAAAAVPAGRLHIDRIEGATVVGWAASADGQAAEVVLRVHGQAVAARVEPVHRQDVLDSLQLGADRALGFRLWLPPAVWDRHGAAAAAVDIGAAGLTAGVALPARLELLVEALRAQPWTAGWDDHLAQLAGVVHAVGPGAIPAGATHDWLETQVRSRGGWAVLTALAAEAGARPQGHVERVDQAVVYGWAHCDALPDEPIGLRCGERLLDGAVIRVEREDVRLALGASRRRLGFEIEIPSTIWQLASAEGLVSLTVHVAGYPIGGAPIEIGRDTLLAWLDRQRGVEAAAGADDAGETDEQRRQRQYATLLLIEHVGAAGLWAALGQAQRSFVLAQAERYGLTNLAWFSGVDLPVEAAAGAPVPVDYATVSVWRLLREFNLALRRDPSQPLQALEAVLAGGMAAGAIGQRFLWSAMPYFCSLGLYAQLRPLLDAGRLRALAASESAWELSLLLPEAVASADLELAAAAMKKIAAGSAGWLNTPCVAQAVRATLDGLERAPVGAGAGAGGALLEAFLDLLEQLAGNAYWSRLHDAELIGALVSLLEAGAAGDEALARRAESLAVRCYALVPDFWRAIDAAGRPVGGWAPVVQQAREHFARVSEAVDRPPQGVPGGVVHAIDWLRSADNVDADQFARELALAGLAQAAPGEAASAALWSVHGGNDVLRLAACPAAVAPELPAAATTTLSDQIRALADVPSVPWQQAITALATRCLAAPADAAPLGAGELRAVRRLARRANGYLGVRLASADWLRARRRLEAAPCAARLAELREMWLAAFEEGAELPQPPAALTASLSLLDAAHAAQPDDALGRVVAEWRDRLQRRYGDESALALATRCASPRLDTGATAYSTLVAIYSCRRNLDGRVQAIRDGWARDLNALGIPWIVVVGDGERDGDARLEGNVLALPVSDAYEALPAKTLALVDWVYRHTRFEHLLKIDDDCHLAAEAYFAQAPYLAHHYHGRRLHRAVGGTDRAWHQARSSTERAAHAIDKSPEPSIYADGGAGYALSRHAMGQVAQALQSTGGARLTRSAFLEDKLLGDLLATRGIGLSSHGHYTLIRRRFGPDALPVNAYDNLFYPSRCSPTLVTHLDGHADLPAVQAGLAGNRLLPARIWPTAGPARLGGSGTNQLELLSPRERVQALADAPVLLVAVARNERVLLPHFLQHYRGLGVQAFAVVDNLSDDGTREYLAAQPDVLLYSADTEYKHSHYGVAWQQAVLGAHALGRWVVLADLDEFLVYPGCETVPIERWIGTLEAAGHDAARVLMVDMYPPGGLDTADFAHQAPFDAAPHFDREPLLPWALGSGQYSNAPTYLSALRHRLIPDSAPNLYTSQKIAVFRYRPWVRLSEGLHYASNLQPEPEPVWFAHFKYHAGFRRKVLTEVARKQHFNGAEEYQKYAGMLAETRGALFQPGASAIYSGSRTWLRTE